METGRYRLIHASPTGTSERTIEVPRRVAFDQFMDAYERAASGDRLELLDQNGTIMIEVGPTWPQAARFARGPKQQGTPR